MLKAGRIDCRVFGFDSLGSQKAGKNIGFREFRGRASGFSVLLSGFFELSLELKTEVQSRLEARGEHLLLTSPDDSLYSIAYSVVASCVATNGQFRSPQLTLRAKRQ